MRLHERRALVAQARIDLDSAIMVRDERHPNDSDKKGDET